MASLASPMKSLGSSSPSKEPKETIKGVPQPERLKIPLFPHQRANIYAMEKMEREKCHLLPDGAVLHGNIGILGDPPGTGKTLTIVGLICRDRMKWKDPVIIETEQVCSNIGGSIRITRDHILPTIGTTLILTPLSIFHQWESELKHSDLRYKMIDRRAHICDLESYEVVVCTVNMYPDLARAYQNVCFKRFVYDEMDSAYIVNMPSISAGFLWFVSATFDQVVEECIRSRKVHFLKRLFLNILSVEYSRETLLHAATIQSSEKLRKLQPVPSACEEIYYEINAAPVVQHLRELMDHELVQMIEAGNISGAIRHLGGDEEDTTIAELMRRRATDDVLEAEGKVAVYKGAQQKEWTQRLDEARHKLGTIEDRIKHMETSECALCSLPMQHATTWSCCQNLSCAKCAAKWLPSKHTCPFCRARDPKIVYLKGNDSDSDSGSESKECESPINIRQSDRFTCLREIVKRGKKVVIFAAFTNQFAAIAETLINEGVSYALLKGGTTHRTDVLDGYTKGDTRVLILDSRTNGAGLNLQCTTDIVLWHTMPPPITRQMIGRALRYGMNHTLKVHKLFTQEQEMMDNASDSEDD